MERVHQGTSSGSVWSMRCTMQEHVQVHICMALHLKKNQHAAVRFDYHGSASIKVAGPCVKKKSPPPLASNTCSDFTQL